MKDGSKTVAVFVSIPASENIEIDTFDRERHFLTFKLYRKSLERIASKKYDKGHVEADGTCASSERELNPSAFGLYASPPIASPADFPCQPHHLAELQREWRRIGTGAGCCRSAIDPKAASRWLMYPAVQSSPQPI
jgi:hypothetical protein